MARKMTKLKISSRLLKKRSRRRNALSSPKSCRFCGNREQAHGIDYKNISLLRHFLTERGKILPSRISGTCHFHQKQVSHMIKKARIMALLAYCAPQY